MAVGTSMLAGLPLLTWLMTTPVRGMTMRCNSRFRMGRNCSWRTSSSPPVLSYMEVAVTIASSPFLVPRYRHRFSACVFPGITPKLMYLYPRARARASSSATIALPMPQPRYSFSLQLSESQACRRNLRLVVESHSRSRVSSLPDRDSFNPGSYVVKISGHLLPYQPLAAEGFVGLKD